MVLTDTALRAESEGNEAFNFGFGRASDLGCAKRDHLSDRTRLSWNCFNASEWTLWVLLTALP